MKRLLTWALSLGGVTCAPTLEPQQDSGAAADPPLHPIETVDIVVIGGGPAGLAAAWEAQNNGATVRVLEMNESAGGAGLYAGRMLGVGTPWQQAAGIVDSPELFLAEWEEITGGGDPEDPWVQRLAHESTDVLSWLESLGAEIRSVEGDFGAGSIDRIHQVDNLLGPVEPLIDALIEETWLDSRAESLVVESGRVIGVEYQDLRTEQTHWIEASATIIAAGGFVRNLDRVLEAQPRLGELSLSFETIPTNAGHNLSLLDEANASYQNLDHTGVYFHSVADPRDGYSGEAVLLPLLHSTVVVDSNGERFADENEVHQFTMVDRVLGLSTPRAWAIFGPTHAEAMEPQIPPYLWADYWTPEAMPWSDLIALGAATEAATHAELATELELNPETLEATLTRYAGWVEAGLDGDFGKDPSLLVPLGDGPYIGLELTAGLAKSFGGARIDTQARVLDAQGTPVPGLYAAGEAAGMLGTEATATGFSGSVTACFLTGREAGQNAAQENVAETQ